MWIRMATVQDGVPEVAVIPGGAGKRCGHQWEASSGAAYNLALH